MSTYKEVRDAYKASNTPITAQWSMNPAGIKSYNEGQGWCCGVDAMPVPGGVLELHRCHKGRGSDPVLNFIPADGGEVKCLANFSNGKLGPIWYHKILEVVEIMGLDYVVQRLSELAEEEEGKRPIPTLDGWDLEKDPLG